MSDTNSSDGHPGTPALEDGVLAALPRTRPQRASPRRAAARSAAAESETVAYPDKPVKAEKRPRAHAPRKRPKPPVRKPVEPPAPKQGYEPEEEIELGKTVNPPSGVELVESLADIVSELAGTGLTAGGRILKDAFSLFRRP